MTLELPDKPCGAPGRKYTRSQSIFGMNPQQLPGPEDGHKKIAVCLYAAFLSLITAYIFFASSKMYFLLNGDIIAFVPPALSWAREGELLNGPFLGADAYDIRGLGRYLHHGYLSAIILGSLAPNPRYTDIVFVLTVICVTGLLFSLILFHSALRTGKSPSWLRYLLASLAFLAACNPVFSACLFGRPESVTTPIVLLLALCLLFAPARARPWLAGGFLGLLAASHFVVLLMAGCLCLCYFAYACENRKRLLQSLFRSSAAFLIVFGMTLVVFPYPFADWVMGNLLHAKDAIITYWEQNNVYWWLLMPARTGFGIMVCLGISSLVLQLLRHHHHIRNKTVFFVSIGLLAAITWYFCVRVPSRNYNLFPFYPLLLAAVLLTFVQWLNGTYGRPCRVKKTAGSLMLIACLSVSSIGFLREMLVFPFFLKHGLSYAQAKSEFESILDRCDETTVDLGALSLLDDHPRALFFCGFPGDYTTPCIIKSQVSIPWNRPPEIPGYTLVSDKFSTAVPRLFGIRLAENVRGYNYAFYQKTENE